MADEETGRKTFRYQLLPTPAQQAALGRTLLRCRTLYNAGLEERKTAWERCSVSLDYYDQANELPDLKQACPEYTAVHSQVLQDVLRRLQKTYDAFFRRIRAGEKPGHPRYKGRQRYRSFTYPQYGNGAVLDGGLLTLSKIGRILVHLHRPIEGTIKTVTLCHEAGGWYVCFSCAEVPVKPLPLTGQETGIDLGLESFATRADGQQIKNPRWYRTAEGHFALCQRRVARRKKGSKRCAKAVTILSKAYRHIANQRRDFQHKEARKLVQQYDVIYHEDLRIRNLVQNHCLAKSISDAGWGQFLTILTFKAASAGKRVVAVNPAYTSQRCSGCGAMVWKGLSTRWHECPECGLSLHRDHNSAREILRLGQEQLYGVAVHSRPGYGLQART